MSALSSKQSSKGNIAISFNNNEVKSTNRNKQKNDKTASKYSSSALSNKHQSMQITFQKTGQKLKKNLSKEFQTFNINNNENKQKVQSNNKEGGKVVNKNGNNEKIIKSKTQAQMTTQAKSPLMKSNLSSKTKLSQQQQKQELSSVKGKTKDRETITRRQQQKSNRSKSPLSQNRSRKSSPQVSPSYSKQSIYSSKRAFSKSRLQNVSNNKNTHKKDNNFYENNKGQNTSFIKQKRTFSKIVNNNNNNTQAKDYQISFPQLITQSQSVYPTSSYPNTGKQSQNNVNTGRKQQDQFQQQQDQDQNYFIAEEQQSGVIQNQEMNEDYISQDHHQHQMEQYIVDYSGVEYQSQQMKGQLGYDRNMNPNKTAYQQLPLSYIMAMQILQKKIQQHQKTINKLKNHIKTKDNQYQGLQNHVKTLQSQLSNKSDIITQKQSQIKFLKGYLNQQKLNNRQALKQVAKNVYQRTISVKKDIKNNQTNQIDNRAYSVRQQKRKLFQNSAIKQQQNYSILVNSQSKPKIDIIQKLIGGQQIQHKKLLQKGQQRQRLLKQELHRQQAIKDEMMRSQILRQQQLKKQLFQQQKQKIQIKQIRQKKQQRYKYLQQSQQKQQDRGAKNSRLQRSISSNTAIKPNKNEINYQGQLLGHTTYRHRNISQRNNLSYVNNQGLNLIGNSNHKHHRQQLSYQKTPIKKIDLKDPVLEKYIQAKSQLKNSYNYGYNNNNISSLSHNKNNILTNNHAQRYQHQLQAEYYLKSERKNRDTVSKMRQLMRAEKELIALNYKLQAIEKKILSTVQSTSSKSDKIKSVEQRQTQQLLLQEMQKQYSMMKKEFQKKQIQVKQLKIKLQTE